MSKPVPQRADAARNRERLIEAARDSFAAGNDSESLENIARAAGVGIGTLYRNFPTREALVEAVYRSELDAVTAMADTLIARHEGFEALRLWMARYTRFVATKRGMLDALRSAWASGSIPASETRARITEAICKILHKGTSDGSIRSDIAAEDVTVSMLAMVLATRTSEDKGQLQRLLDLLLEGLRARGSD
ncbi:TetR/AcrR family transcriptional regulator [Dyella sp.]|uniref:TetR/AcrR family transcriptional regulator n=1 Tax=Dyella sp. TaxID=1869338 RepID=UPI002ED5B7B2